MGVSFAGYECVDAGALAISCREASPPLPTAPWLGAANRFTHPIGLRPGRGHILLRRKHLNKLTAVAKYPLVFSAFPANDGMSSETRTIKNVRVVGQPIAITPGVRDDEDTTFFVELADRRIDCVGLCGKRYNWRIHPDSTYESASLNSSSEWTWTTLLTDLWNAVGNLGTFPDLPSTPVGTPSQIDGMGCRAADLLEDLLLLNGMAVRYDPEKDTFSIVSFASNATGFFGKTLIDKSLQEVGSALRNADDKRIWDQEPLLNTDPKLPGYVRVIFPVWSAGGTPIDTASYYVVDVADTAPDSTRLSTSSYALVQDFLPCRTNQVGTVLNGSDLVTRAAAVAANFYNVARLGTYGPLSRTYTGIGQGSVILPGTALDVLVWEDLGDGPKTHVIQTGRLGFPPIFDRVGSLYTSGSLLTGNPMGASTNFQRYPVGSTDAANPILRVSNIPPGESRTYGTGPLASPTGASMLASGGGESSILERDGPLRQWDAAVEARSVDGNGQRLWRAKNRTEHSCFVKVTSLTKSGIYYPAIEQLIDPTTGVVTSGDVCWWFDPNTSIAPGLNSVHWSYLDGTDGATPAVKVYAASTGAALLSSSFGMSAARVYHSSNQSIAASTTVTLAFDSERFDTDAFHDTVTNNSRFTIPTGKGGTYLVGAQINWQAAIVATFSAQIILNGTTILAKTELTTKSNYFSTLYQLSETDYVEVQVYHADGTAQSVSVQANYSAEFWIMRAGASTGSSPGRVYGQAKESPALPGDGPRQTMDMTRATPTVGNNLDVTLTDDAANDRLTWTIDNLGQLVRKNSTGSTYGPRRRLNFIESNASVGTTIGITVADDAGNDEVDVTIDALGVFARAKSGTTYGPRKRLNFLRAAPTVGNNLDVTAADDAVDGEVEITVDNLGVFVRTNSGANTNSPRRRLNFIDDTQSAISYLAWTKTDDAGNDEIDLQPTINLPNVVAYIQQNNGGPDWHYFRQVQNTLRSYNPLPLGYATRSGLEFQPLLLTGGGETGVMVAVPYLDTRGGTINKIGVYVGAAADAGSEVRVGIYQSVSATNLAPWTLVLDAGLIAVDVVGYYEVSCAYTFASGYLYWLVIRYDDDSIRTNPIPLINGYTPTETMNLWQPFGLANPVGGTGNFFGYAYGKNLGALAGLPATFPTTAGVVATTAASESSPLVYVGYSA